MEESAGPEPAEQLPEPLPPRPAPVVRRRRATPVLAELARRPAVVAGTSAVAALGVRAVAGAVARHVVRRQAAVVAPTTLVVNVVVLSAHHGAP